MWRETRSTPQSPHKSRFQSTPSVWRETPVFVHKNCNPVNFNPLPPCGGRLEKAGQEKAGQEFQSTPSVWRETQCAAAALHTGTISIHSLRVEGDGNPQFAGEDPGFQSTPSVWRETADGRGGGSGEYHFNPLPPCGGRHGLISLFHDICKNFNPLPPCGGRHS